MLFEGGGTEGAGSGAAAGAGGGAGSGAAAGAGGGAAFEAAAGQGQVQIEELPTLVVTRETKEHANVFHTFTGAAGQSTAALLQFACLQQQGLRGSVHAGLQVSERAPSCSWWPLAQAAWVA